MCTVLYLIHFIKEPQLWSGEFLLLQTVTENDSLTVHPSQESEFTHTTDFLLHTYGVIWTLPGVAQVLQ